MTPPAGRYAPCWEKEGPPFDPEAAGVEGLAMYGLILLIPQGVTSERQVSVNSVATAHP